MSGVRKYVTYKPDLKPTAVAISIINIATGRTKRWLAIRVSFSSTKDKATTRMKSVRNIPAHNSSTAAKSAFALKPLAIDVAHERAPREAHHKR